MTMMMIMWYCQVIYVQRSLEDLSSEVIGTCEYYREMTIGQQQYNVLIKYES